MAGVWCHFKLCRWSWCKDTWWAWTWQDLKATFIGTAVAVVVMLQLCQPQQIVPGACWTNSKLKREQDSWFTGIFHMMNLVKGSLTGINHRHMPSDFPLMPTVAASGALWKRKCSWATCLVSQKDSYATVCRSQCRRQSLGYPDGSDPANQKGKWSQSDNLFLPVLHLRAWVIMI